MSGSPCIAYRADGTLCGEPATILDRLGLRYRDFMSWHHSGIWLGRAVSQPLGATPVLHRRRRVLRRPRGYVAETAIMHYIDASPDATPPDKLDVFDVLLANERIDVKGSLHPDLAGQVMPWLKGRWIGAYIFISLCIATGRRSTIG